MSDLTQPFSFSPPPPPLQVAKGRSLFGDPTSEIQELTQVIKQDLAKMNSDIASLQQRVKARSHQDSRHVRSHSSSVVVSLQVHVASFTARSFTASLVPGPSA